MKNLKVTVDNSRVMDGIERAHIKITSPTGKTIYIYKNKLNKVSIELREIFWKYCNDPMVRFVGEMDTTVEDMKQLLRLSKIY